MSLIIYHKMDLDGICSAAILHNRFPNARLFGYQYNEPFDISTVEEGEMVIMADVSMPMEVMEQIAERSGEFYWIDHHVSAMKDYESYFGLVAGTVNELGHPRLKYHYRPDISACEACWKFAFPGLAMPEAVHLLGEYDTWRGHGTERWNEIILPFQYGMRLNGFTPGTLSEYLTDPYNYEKILEGKCILKYQAEQDKILMRKSFTAKIGEFTAICCVGAYGSLAFASVYDESKHDIMVGLSFDGKTWGFSFRTSKDIDVSLIAKKFGGGGHKSASGCHSDDIRKILEF